MSTEKSEVQQQAVFAARAASEKLGTDTLIMDVGDVLGICDFFVITSGDNSRQVKAITEAVEGDLLKRGGIKPISIEGGSFGQGSGLTRQKIKDSARRNSKGRRKNVTNIQNMGTQNTSIADTAATSRENIWVLMDYGDFIVHVFLKETREFYQLERLWDDCPRIGF